VIQGAGSNFNATNSVHVGGDGITARGQGTLRVETGGAATVGQTLRVYSTGSLELLGSNVTAHDVTIDSGGALVHSNGTLTIDGGHYEPGVGGSYYAIDGPDATSLPTVVLKNGATLNLSNTLFAGFNHAGKISIESGAVVTSLNGRIGWVEGTSDGRVTVKGAGSRWTNSADLEVGVRNLGLLEIQDNGRVENTVGSIAPVPGSQASVVVNGGTWNNSDALCIGGRSSAGGVGSLTVAGSGNVHAAGVKVWPQGTVVLENALMTSSENMVLAGGALHGAGWVRLPILGGAALVNAGVVSPGVAADPYGVLAIQEGDYVQSNLGSLSIDVAGDLPGLTLDQIEIERAATLAGTLHVTLASGFTPQFRKRYAFLTADYGVNGKFDVEDLPLLTPGVRLVVDYNVGEVSLFLTYDADFDEDGDVDGDDLAKWQTNFGLTSGALHAQGDANRDTIVDGGDFLVWQRQVGSGVVHAAAIPEPATTVFGIAGCLALALIRRRAA
jgi:T5SS/PEP-CTERM-associated repeat protein